MLYKSSLKEARTEFKYWIAPDDTLYEVHPSETHEGWLYDWSGEDYAYHDALEDGWIRVIGITHILYFNCSGYDNKKFKRIYTALQKNFKLGSYSDDIEVVDDKDNKRYRYYGRKMKPVLSESESIIDQVNTPEFKKWFGKSKVVDSQGKPLVVYHGSKDKFDTFDYSKMSWQTIQSQQGSGFYFTDVKRQASAYGKAEEFYLSIENPLILKYHSKNITFDQAMKIYSSGDNDWFFTDYLAFQLSKEKGVFSKEELLAEWIKKGMNYENDIFVVQNMKRAYKESSYGKMMKLFMSVTKFDGLIQEVSGGLKVYVAYKPNQIKSATGNNGMFSKGSDNINESYESRFREDAKLSYNIREKYKLFNKLYFKNTLPSDLVIKSINKSAKYIAQIVFDSKRTSCHMEVNLKHFESLSEKNKDAVIIHEMIHIWVSVSGNDRKGNLHQGEFLIKAKELEKKTGLKLSGTKHKDSEDYVGVEKVLVYVVIKTYTKVFLKKNALAIDFYSTLERAEETGERQKELSSFSHIYLIETNSPIIKYDIIKKNVDSSRGWLVYNNAFVKMIMDGIGKYPEHSKLIKVI